MDKTKQEILFVGTLILIVVAIVVGYMRLKTPKAEAIGRSFSFTTYAMDETDNSIYFFGHDSPLRWPITYQGRTLWPLFRCSQCERTFVVHGDNERHPCPFCNSTQTGHYPKRFADAINAEKIDFDDLEMATTN